MIFFRRRAARTKPEPSETSDPTSAYGVRVHAMPKTSGFARGRVLAVQQTKRFPDLTLDELSRVVEPITAVFALASERDQVLAALTRRARAVRPTKAATNPGQRVAIKASADVRGEECIVHFEGENGIIGEWCGSLPDLPKDVQAVALMLYVSPASGEWIAANVKQTESKD